MLIGNSTKKTRDEFEAEIGYPAYRRIIVKMLKQGTKPIDVARALGATVASVRAISKRLGLHYTAQPKTTFIYTLTCPITNQIKWVGKANRPKTRLLHHLRRQTNAAMREWIAQLVTANLRPIVDTLVEVPFKHWRRAERAFIRKLRKHHPLLNRDD